MDCPDYGRSLNAPYWRQVLAQVKAQPNLCLPIPAQGTVLTSKFFRPNFLSLRQRKEGLGRYFKPKSILSSAA